MAGDQWIVHYSKQNGLVNPVLKCAGFRAVEKADTTLTTSLHLIHPQFHDITGTNSRNLICCKHLSSSHVFTRPYTSRAHRYQPPGDTH